MSCLNHFFLIFTILLFLVFLVIRTNPWIMSINLYHHTSSFQCPLRSSVKRDIETYFHFYLTLSLHPLLLWINGMTALLCICITNKLCMTNTCLGALYHSQYVESGFNIHPLVWMDLGSLFLLRKAPLCFPGSPLFGNIFLWHLQLNGDSSGYKMFPSLWLAPGSFKHCYLVGHSNTDKKWCLRNPLSHDWVMHKFSLFSVLALLSFFDRIYFEFEFFISCSLEYRKSNLRIWLL